MTKKLISLILSLAVLPAAVPCMAAETDVKYIKSAEEYDYGTPYVWLAADDNGIIPLSLEPLDGYTYAYAPNSDEIRIEKVEPVKFTDTDEINRSGFVLVPGWIDEMSARGVLTGYDDGTFRPTKTLTRAEMAAVFARMFSIAPSDEKSCFSDVEDSFWGRGYIMALVDKGVFKRDEKFNPDAEITREQLTAMTYRMLTDMDCAGDTGEYDFSAFTDTDSISDYAREAYNNLLLNGYRPLMFMDYSNEFDMADDKFLLEPHKSVTRYECVDFLYCFIRDFFRNNAPAIKRDGAPSEEIPILDGSTSTHDITSNIFREYYLNHENHPNFPKQHSKTSNSYKRLIDGEVEMIFVPDPSEDIKQYAEEKGVKLKYIPIANEAMVFFTAKNNKADNITTEQLHNIYVNNGIKNWSEIGGDDAELVPFCRNLDSGSHAQMEKFILDGGEINEAISREHTSWIMSSILTEVDDFNRDNAGKYAIGYSLYYYYFNSQMFLGSADLKLMKINGVAPTEDTIADGTYPYTTNYYAVVRDEENEKVDKFAELMQSEFGDAIIKMSGMGVIKK